jgi:hypothetical protein
MSLSSRQSDVKESKPDEPAFLQPRNPARQAEKQLKRRPTFRFS